MTTQPDVIQQSELLNQLVLDRNTMEELGRVEVLWMYVPAHRVLGFVCKSGFLGAKKLAFNLSQIHTFGKASILVTSNPQETDAEKVRQLESLVNSEVWSDAGTKLGKITDYRFNVKTGVVTDYLFVTGEWSALANGVYLLPPSKILSTGRKRVLISESIVQSLALHREGIKQKLKKAEDLLKDDYSQITHELQTLSQQARSATEQVKERAQFLRRASRSLAEQARERARTLNEQLKESTQTLAQQAKETGQGFVEQVKEQTQVIQDQLAAPDLSQSPESSAVVDEFDAIFADWELESPSTPPVPSSTPPLVEDPIDIWDSDPPATTSSEPAPDAPEDFAAQTQPITPGIQAPTTHPSTEDDEPWV